MARKRYVGPMAAAPPDIATVGYVTQAKSADISSESVDTQINAGYGPYVNKSYVDGQDALNANKAYIDAGDAGRLKISAKDVNNGVAGLQANGKVAPVRINLSNNQRWPRAFWSPPAYNTTEVNATTTETTVYTCEITDPGFPYKIVTYGQADLASTSDTSSPIVRVRVGSASGQIIARGTAMSEGYLTSTGVVGEDLFTRTTTAPDLGPDWSPAISEGVGLWRCDGNQVTWVEQGTNADGNKRTMRINPLDKVTDTDNQRMYAQQGGNNALSNFGVESSINRYFLRVSEDFTHYVYFWNTGRDHGLIYRAGGAEASLGRTNGSNHNDNDQLFEIVAENRTFDVYLNGTSILHLVDTLNVTSMGPDYRGWGFGMLAGAKFFGGQASPANLSSIRVEDVDREYAYDATPLMPLDLNTQTVKTGPTTLYMTLARTGGTGTVRQSILNPSIWPMAVPA